MFRAWGKHVSERRAEIHRTIEQRRNHSQFMFQGNSQFYLYTVTAYSIMETRPLLTEDGAWYGWELILFLPGPYIYIYTQLTDNVDCNS